MKRITVSYVHYFNKKYKRVGHLFQDRYRSKTNLPIRKIAAITGMNKDKVNKMLKNRQKNRPRVSLRTVPVSHSGASNGKGLTSYKPSR